MLKAFLLAVTAVVDLTVIPLRMTPPDPYRGDVAVVVQFVSNQEVMNTVCHNPDPKQDIVGCAFKFKKGLSVLFLQNPCLYPDDRYARSVCHEMGHVNGWPRKHPNPQ